MKVIFKRTLQETLRPVPIILSLLAGILGGYVIGNAADSLEAPAYVYYLNKCLLIQHMVVFFLITGVVLMAITAATASGLIAGEVHEGTFRLLIVKPISRRAILLGKVLGMMCGAFLHMLLGLAVMVVFETTSGSFDRNIIAGLLGYLPGYLLYGTIVILFISSLAVLLSCVMKKRMFALLPMLVVLVMILMLPSVLRLTISLTGNISYEGNKLYLVDMNYHFAQIFSWCLKPYGGISGTSGQLEVLSVLTNLYTYLPIDRDVAHTQYMNSIMLPNNMLSMNLLVIVYLVLTAVNYLGSFAIISRKDV